MSLAKLDNSIAEIKHAKEFDPVRFTLIENLYARLQNTQHKKNQLLINKTQQRVDEYKADFERAQSSAHKTLEKITLELPEQVEKADSHHRNSEFKQLDQLLEKLKHQQRQEPLLDLRNLKYEMTHVEENGLDIDEPESLDELLFHQEQNARINTGSAQLPDNGTDKKFELQSMKNFRESMKYFNIDKIISRAINDFPENAGPHNPHMLAIKSLMNMRDLSPQYLRRFASYIETILWLEKNSVKLNKKKT